MNSADKQAKALGAIKALYDTEDGEFGPTLFVSHHLEELEADEWVKACGVEKPDAKQILDCLVLRSSWSSEDNDDIDTFDFSLPHALTNYVLAVRFEGDEVDDVAMES